MTELSLSTQAKLLARYLSEKNLTSLSHSQALEAVAYTQNFKSFNEAQTAKQAQTSDVVIEKSKENALTFLKAAHEHGLTPADAREFFAAYRTPAELAFADAASSWHNEGELECDEDAEVSMAEPRYETGGAYVQMWKWIPVEDVLLPHDLLDALKLPWKTLGLYIEDDEYSIEFNTLEFNQRAIVKLKAGEAPLDSIWLVRGSASAGHVFDVLTVKSYKALTFDASQDSWVGNVDGEDWLIELS